ncbi:MAG TPA: PH domain-containing protein [Patescibacteria group bacterium]|nr:PH domain-containing protein [Patescibacteria group bacterium]
MTTIKQVNEQLKRVGCNFRFWGRPEIRELPNILMQDEIITKCVNGYYEGGFALLCVTNHRLLLVDRKPMFLATEDIRFDMIVEMDYSAQLMNSTVKIMTPNKKMTFSSWSQHRLREILRQTQQRIMEVRQHYLSQQFQQPASIRYITPVVAGGLALQGDGQQTIGMSQYCNPYIEAPLSVRRHHLPNFY